MAMTNNFETTVLEHKLPDGVFVHPNSPWKALRTCYAHPYILTSDTFGGATNVWTIEETPLPVVTRLQPALPTRASSIWAACTKNGDFLVVGYGIDKQGDPAILAVTRVYSLDSGGLIDEIKQPGRFAHTSFSRVASGAIVVAIVDEKRRPRVLVYSVSSAGLKEMRRVLPRSTDTPGDENLIPLYLADDTSLLISSTFIPSSSITLTYHDFSPETSQLELAAAFHSDCLEPNNLLAISPSSIVIAITESHSDEDYQLQKSTVHCISYPSLTMQWHMAIPYKTTRITHYPALGVVLTTFRPAESHSSATITLLDDTTGRVLKEEEVPIPSDDEIKALRCTPAGLLVIVYGTGRFFARPLKAVFEDGPPLKDGQLEVTGRIAGPEPYNAKARKAGDNWKWVEHVVVGPARLFAFGSRGPEMFTLGLAGM